jgi:dipeptidase D
LQPFWIETPIAAINPTPAEILNGISRNHNATIPPIADNGIAVAFALALLDSKDLAHPALEVLVTSDEEMGMSGAQNLDPSLLSSKNSNKY